jgi:maltose O-acetyltransferase
MGQARKIICALLMNLIGHHLPESWRKIKIGKFTIKLYYGRYFRGFLAKYMLEKCGKNVDIQKRAHFSLTGVQLGSNSGIGAGSIVPSYTTIGDNVMMGPEVLIYNQNHSFKEIDKPMRKQGFQDIKPVTIGDDVWIGARVIILPGVKIGNGCVIGAGAVVSTDIPDFSVAVGNRARVVKYRANTENK